MSIIDTIRTMKQVHPSDVLLVKIGKFYHAYGKDAYIISYLFNYQLKKIENINSTGFPEIAINKVSSLLEGKNISYQLFDKNNNYNVLKTYDFKEKNYYAEMYNKAQKYHSRKIKIDNISEYLLSNIDDDKVISQLQDIESLLYENIK